MQHWWPMGVAKARLGLAMASDAALPVAARPMKVIKATKAIANSQRKTKSEMKAMKAMKSKANSKRKSAKA